MRHGIRRWCAVGLAALVLGAAPRAQRAGGGGAAASSGVDVDRLQAIDTLVTQAIAEGKTPGAVVLIGRGDRILFQKAYGHRSVAPQREPMTVDTVFDLASLTKVVATTTSVMILVENGQVRLSDTVASFIPEFGKYGKERVTVRELLTHTSGLRPDLDLAEPWAGAETAIKLASEEVLSPAPHRFVYSDINFELLGEIVARVTKIPLETFARDHVFGPLGMRDTTFKPAAALRSRIAPTQVCRASEAPCELETAAPNAGVGAPLRGVVHDPTARRMGGVAGHAGLFSTASDLAIFCRMLLDGGTVGAARVLSPLTVSRMTSPAGPATEPNVRGLGWDFDSSYSANRGELLPLGSFGHTGFTGTSLWIDPASRLYVVFLSNRVHPDGSGDVTPLRARVATLAASALTDVTPAVLQEMSWPQSGLTPSVPAAVPSPPVETGIDMLRAQNFAPLKGLRVGLVTNHTGRTRDGVPTIDALAAAADVKLVALFSPEHGIRGLADEAVVSTRDEKTGLPIHSLYGQTTRPTAEMLAGIDAMVFDVQDIGTRFYTYITTLAYVMEEAAARKIKVFVLDRPNPIGGVQIEGPSLDASGVGFTGYFPQMPIRHGMTIGELAKLFNGEKKIGADLTVIQMKNWRRDAWFDDTSLEWVNPSPNMRNLYEATLYPGIGAFENANISVGRGTDTPFERVGAPWIDGMKLAEALNARRIAGVRFYPVRFTPGASKFANQECQGVGIVITDREVMRPVRVGVELAASLVKLFPGKFQIDTAARLFGSAASVARIKAADDPGAVAASWNAAEARWRLVRAKYLIY